MRKPIANTMKLQLLLVAICFVNTVECRGKENRNSSTIAPVPEIIISRSKSGSAFNVPSSRAKIVYPGHVTKPNCDAGALCRPYANCTAAFFSTLPVDGICRWEGFDPYVCCPVKDGPQLKLQSTAECARWMRPITRQRRSAPPTGGLRNSSAANVAANNATGATAGRTTTEESGDGIGTTTDDEQLVKRFGDNDDDYNTTDTADNRLNDIEQLDENGTTVLWPESEITTLADYEGTTINYSLLVDYVNQPQHAVGGVRVERIEDWPFMAGIFKKINDVEKAFLCGASLITKTVVLTAAHCFISNDHLTSRYVVRFGSLILESTVPSREAEASRIIVHPHFRFPSLYNDIALVRFDGDGKTKYSPLFRPICLPDVEERDNQYLDTRLITMGWGANDYGGALSPELMEVEVPVVDAKTCNSVYSKLGALTGSFQYGIGETIICAGNTEEVKDACRGDSGGPLISIDQDFLPRVVGVVSSGQGCGTLGVPGLYTRVDRYMDWIEANLENN